jgi:hypothetical protein
MRRSSIEIDAKQTRFRGIDQIVFLDNMLLLVTAAGTRVLEISGAVATMSRLAVMADVPELLDRFVVCFRLETRCCSIPRRAGSAASSPRQCASAPLPVEQRLRF